MNDNASAYPNLPWHTLPPAEVLQKLDSSESGLSSDEARARLAAHGPNELQVVAGTPAWKILVAQFANFLLIILLVAALLSAFLGHTLEAVVIAIIVLFAAVLGFVQEYRAERSLAALRRMAAPTARVLRDGNEGAIPARDLVAGDLILLQAGDRIPADGRLLEAVNLQTEEAPLTGESTSVDKKIEILQTADLPVGDRSNMVFAGTAAVYGRGRAVVTGTGMNSEFGRIAGLLQSVETGRTPLQENLDRAGRILARSALALVAVIILFGLWRGQPLLEMLIFGIALAVAVVPEALPAVVTISLALGVQRMVRRHALVRRLPAVETLGSVSVICTDKTGTLTRNEMTVQSIHVDARRLEVTGVGYAPAGEFLHEGKRVEITGSLRELLLGAMLASDARLVREGGEERWTIRGDATEGALVVAAAKAGLRREDLEGKYPRADEIPFTSERKRMTTLHAGPEGLVAFAKGAPEVILPECNRRLTEAGEVPLTPAGREEILGIAREMADAALRVLAVAGKSGASRETAEEEMVFLGLLGMIDPPRTEVREAIRASESAGIRPIMITGDHPRTATAIARELGLLKGRVITGADLDAMDDAELRRSVPEIAVYARVSPAHKLRVVTALQQNGEIAAMTGDGVNDAPALKKADIGIAMGVTGTDVTREAAAMVLTDDNYASIVAAVEEGRGIFSNIKKYLMYLLSSNIGEIGLIGSATLLGLPLPLTAVQILYVNLATDGLPALALAVDPPEPDLMQRPPRDPRSGIFSRPVVALILAGGIWSAAVNLGIFIWARASGRGTAEAMTMTFVLLVLIQFFKAYNFRSDHRSILDRPFANRWLNVAILWEMVLLLLIVYLPPLQVPFATFSLTHIDWLIVTALAVSVVPVLEGVKWWVRRRERV
jgi:Ca2+-transporting ATPase